MSPPRRPVSRWVVALMLLPIGAVLGGLFLAEPMRVSSGSMSPSFDMGDEVLVDKVSARSADPPRGDVIVLRSPATGELMIKRVAAVGGERVGINDGVLVVDGHRVPEPYLDRATVDGTYFGPVRVPRGSVFVLGDARAGSVDSRTFGPVTHDAILGRVLMRLW